ncbi:MAG: tetratricopeptide repeat protein [Dysgonamonadaceae bacterium]|jgi:tetratricopeptide (TPR) repeat protein|nr:tetratricopeptide repeat protein [Dysgonamonadaceae bacterium]
MEVKKLQMIIVLVGQKRYDDAKKQLADALAENPNDISALTWLAEVNYQQNNLHTASDLANSALALSPNDSVLFYIKSRIAEKQDDLSEAEKQINEAIRLNPYEPEFFAELGNIKMMIGEFEHAIKYANKALEIAPNHLTALNIRGTSLRELHENKDALKNIEIALRENPNDAYTQANYGWGLMKKGNYKKAFEHFKEALRIDPYSEFARMGMLQVLRERNPIYRLLSNCISYMGEGVVIGVVFFFVLLMLNGFTDGEFLPIIILLIVPLALGIFSALIITPIGNLFLRFNRYGQMLLSKKEKISSSFVEASLGVFIVGLVLYFVQSDVRFLTIAVFGFVMMLPFSTMFLPLKTSSFIYIAVVLTVVLGIASIGVTFRTRQMFNEATAIFAVTFLFSQWIINSLPKKKGG